MESTILTKETLPATLDDFGWFAQDRKPVERAVLLTLAYADLFDYPLSVRELHRYLIGSTASRICIEETLSSRDGFRRVVTSRDGYLTLASREHIIQTRRARARIAADFWPQAFRYGRIFSRLPFVRMVAVTGALAMDNVDESGDIDYLVITEPGRLWLSRAWCILLVRIARRQGTRICPNYFLATSALHDLQHSLYSAHEISQMIPISGSACYQELRGLNGWVYDYLPNSAGPPRVIPAEPSQGLIIQKAAEYPQRSRLGNALESWEMNRKIRRFGGVPHAESRFSSDHCKGHFELHGEKTLTALESRLASIESLL